MPRLTPLAKGLNKTATLKTENEPRYEFYHRSAAPNSTLISVPKREQNPSRPEKQICRAPIKSSPAQTQLCKTSSRKFHLAWSAKPICSPWRVVIYDWLISCLAFDVWMWPERTRGFDVIAANGSDLPKRESDRVNAIRLGAGDALLGVPYREVAHRETPSSAGAPWTQTAVGALWLPCTLGWRGSARRVATPQDTLLFTPKWNVTWRNSC